MLAALTAFHEQDDWRPLSTWNPTYLHSTFSKCLPVEAVMSQCKSIVYMEAK